MGFFSRIKSKPMDDDHFRLFSPTPEENCHPINPGQNNAIAHKMINDGILIESVSSGKKTKASDIGLDILMLCTTWETFSAKSIGSLKKMIDSGYRGKVGVLFYESSIDEIKTAKIKSWYYNFAYVLSTESYSLRDKINMVPIKMLKEKTGNYLIIDGVLEA